MVRKVFSLTLFSLIIFLPSQSEAATSVESLVDKFMSLTEVQQKAYAEKIEGSITLYGSGKVEDVEEPSWIDEVRGYYKVITELQTTSEGNTYKIVFCFSDINKVINFNKGDRIRGAGKLLKITNWGFWVSVWILVE